MGFLSKLPEVVSIPNQEESTVADTLHEKVIARQTTTRTTFRSGNDFRIRGFERTNEFTGH